jgi:26S proteasome regulatory subunit N2
MHSGITSDFFLCDNLEWVSNWSKFSATTALTVIHKGYVLGPYLPLILGGEPNARRSLFGGRSTLCTRLINAGCSGGWSVEGYLREMLRIAQGEIMQHEAALGLGVAGMGGKNPKAFNDLNQTLFTDSAIAGEAAGYAMGLVLLGTADTASADEMPY